MIARMTKAEGRAFLKRWQRVNEQEKEELRKTPMSLKFQQIASLMASVDQFGWRAALSEGAEAVRERWNRIRRACRG